MNLVVFSFPDIRFCVLCIRPKGIGVPLIIFPDCLPQLG